jgi:hypothetical protein
MNDTITSVGGRVPPGAKKAAAFRRISLARFNSRFSRSSALSLMVGTRQSAAGAGITLGLTYPMSQGFSSASDLARERTHCPLGSMFCLLLKDQSDGPLSDLRGIFRCSVHDSILSRIGVSG